MRVLVIERQAPEAVAGSPMSGLSSSAPISLRTPCRSYSADSSTSLFLTPSRYAVVGPACFAPCWRLAMPRRFWLSSIMTGFARSASEAMMPLTGTSSFGE